MLRSNATALGFVTLMAAGCGGAETAVESTRPGRSSPDATCAQGATLACSCVDGKLGVKTCQVDNSFGVCNCSAVNTASMSAAGSVASQSGVATPPVAATTPPAAASPPQSMGFP